MPIVIKKINVTTTVETKVVLPTKMSDSVYEKLKEEFLEKLSEQETRSVSERTRKER